MSTSIAVVTIAIISAGFKMVFQDARLAEVANTLVNRVDDGLAVRPNVVDTSVEIEDPIQRLLWWGDVICLRTEDNDR